MDPRPQDLRDKKLVFLDSGQLHVLNPSLGLLICRTGAFGIAERPLHWIAGNEACHMAFGWINYSLPQGHELK